MMVSIASRCPSVKVCAEAADGAATNASANRAGESRRSGDISNSFLAGCSESGLLVRLWGGIGIPVRSETSTLILRACTKLEVGRIVLLCNRQLCRHDIVGLDPSRRADGETGLGA